MVNPDIKNLNLRCDALALSITKLLNHDIIIGNTTSSLANNDYIGKLFDDTKCYIITNNMKLKRIGSKYFFHYSSKY